MTDDLQAAPPLKYSASMSLDGATLRVRRSGYGEHDGSGHFVFDEDDVLWKAHDERDGCYLEVKLVRSEMIELRDFLLREYPLEAPNVVVQATRGAG